MKQVSQKMSKAVMAQYLQYINPSMTDGDIFGVVRSIENASPDDFVVDNWDEFYWFLRDYRDGLRKE